MNEVLLRTSGRVQRAPPKVIGMIGEPGHPTGQLEISLEEDTTMLKTISAALLAVSVLAAPALAATPAKDVAKTTQKSVQAPVIKAEPVKMKPSVRNANAKMGRHHHAHYRHHRAHKHFTAAKSHQKVTVKPATSAVKRG